MLFGSDPNAFVAVFSNSFEYSPTLQDWLSILLPGDKYQDNLQVYLSIFQGSAFLENGMFSWLEEMFQTIHCRRDS
jgi:hypothetical protein